MSDDEQLRNSLQPGHKLHWYRIEKVLGQGGFGITYLAYDANLDQHVAIKEYLPMELAVRDGDHSVYPASQAQDKRYKWGLERFLTEAQTLARFKHPAIVRVFSVFEENNTAYMVMEYQQGMSLQQHLENRRTLPERELVALLIPLLEGLETIHAQGFIHRDIKPSNIFIHTGGHPVLLDFGSARQALGEETRTLTSVVSPGYAPFEQYYSKSDRQGPWTDIYGLGATLYRCLSGVQPMASIDRSEAILRAERDVFISATELGAGQYSANFLSAVDCALFFNETKRPQTIAEWRALFEFSTSAENRNSQPLQTTYPEDARTRFSALVDAAANLDSGTIVNPDVRSKPVSSASKRSARNDTRPRADTSERSDSQRRRDAQPPYESSHRDDSGRYEESRTHSERYSERLPNARPRWPWVIALLLLAAAGGVGYTGYAGLLPNGLFGGGKAARFVAQGDRALGAGLIFEPRLTSALAFYQRAYEVRPGDVDAVHGLRLTGGRLIEAILAAISAGDIGRAQVLASELDGIPPGLIDVSEVRAELAAARAQSITSEQQNERVQDYLAAAQDDVSNGKFVGNGTDNALAKYRAVQILDADNAAAVAGLSALAAALAERGRRALAENELETALEWHGQASLLDADGAEVLALGAAVVEAQNLSSSQQERAVAIQTLLESAARDIAGNRLTSPPGENALERYRKVENLDPGNAEAREGLRKIHDRYIVLATQALTRAEFPQARQLASKALGIERDSEPARALQSEIAAAAERQDRELAERLAGEAEARLAQAEATRAAAEAARVEAEQERKRRQEAEAHRLLAVAEAKARAEREARDSSAKIIKDAEHARPRVVVDFQGFHPKYGRDGLTRDLLFKKVAPLIHGAGYEIVTRGQVHDANYAWTNVKLMAYRLSVNENTATGLYSYAGSLNILEDASLRTSLSAALDKPPQWTRGHSGLGPPTDLRTLLDRLVDITQAFVENRPGRRR